MRIGDQIGINHIFKYYQQEKGGSLSQSEFIKIATGYNKFLIKKVLEGEEVPLPNRLGTLHIRGKKPRIGKDVTGAPTNLAVDWKKSNELWKKSPSYKGKKFIYHINLHTDGLRYKYHWSRKKMNLFFKDLYYLKMTRANKRAVAKSLKSGVEYIIKFPKTKK